jgi:hypothetical protein
VITSYGEHTPPTQKVEIFLSVLVVQILPYTALISFIEANSLEHMDHLLIEMAGVQLVALDLSLGDELSDVKTHSSSQLRIENLDCRTLGYIDRSVFTQNIDRSASIISKRVALTGIEATASV